jgi:hypothetical protein
MFLLFLRAMALDECPSAPGAVTITPGPALTGCTVDGLSPVTVLGTGDVVIEGTTFIGFTDTALRFGHKDQVGTFSGSVLLSSVTFRDFAVTTRAFAVEVRAMTELRMTKVDFVRISGGGAVNAGQHSQESNPAYWNMWTFYGITCTDVAQVPDLGIFGSGCLYLYGEDLTVTSSSGACLISLWGHGTSNVPILRALKATNVSVNPGLFIGLSGESFFIVEDGLIKDTPNKYASSAPRMYFESTQFIVSPGRSLAGIDNNGGVSAIDCLFEGCSIGVDLSQSTAGVFVCRSKFLNCEKGLVTIQTGVEIVSSFFSGYAVAGLVLSGGNADTLIKDCTFDDTDAFAITCQILRVVGCCFGRKNGVSISAPGYAITLGAGCCFWAESASVAISALDIALEEEGIDPGYSCTKACTAESVPVGPLVCLGYSFPLRPTPQPTQSPIIPMKGEATETPQDQEPPTPIPTPAVTDAASTILETPTPLASTIEETETAFASTIEGTGTPEPSTPPVTAEPTISWTPVPSPLGTPSHLFDETEDIAGTTILTNDLSAVPRSLAFSVTSLAFSSDYDSRSGELIQTKGHVGTLSQSESNLFDETEDVAGTTILTDDLSAVPRSLAFSVTSLAFSSDDDSRSGELIQTKGHVGTLSQIESNLFDETEDIGATAVELDLSWDPSRPFEWSIPREGSNSVVTSLSFTASLGFSSTNVFSPSLGFPVTSSPSLSLAFMTSVGFSASEVFAPSDGFILSSPFTESPQGPLRPESFADAPADQVSGAVSGAAIGGATAGGLAALALLSLLLLFLLKKKKKQVEEPEETTKSPTGTIDDGDQYISEYGLSDGGVRFDSGEDREDLPHGSRDISEQGSLEDQLSERNPDES